MFPQPSDADPLRSVITFSQIDTFLALVEDGSVLRAADRLKVGRSTVSAHAKAIADEIGHHHFKRSGGQISIITQSGGNQIHGSAYEFFRNSALDARNYFDQAHIPPFQRNDFGAALGGPIRKDKLFAFAGYQRTVSKQSQAATQAHVPTPANLLGDFFAAFLGAPQPRPAVATQAPVQVLRCSTRQQLPGRICSRCACSSLAGRALIKCSTSVSGVAFCRKS